MPDSSPSLSAPDARETTTPATNPVRAAERVVLDDHAIRRTLMRMAHEIAESADEIDRLYLVAIPNGGVPLGRVLCDNLESLTGHRPPMGILDTTLYRDDLSTRGSRPQLRRTEMHPEVARVYPTMVAYVPRGWTHRAVQEEHWGFTLGKRVLPGESGTAFHGTSRDALI